MRQVVCLSGRRPVPLCSGAEQKGLYKSGNAQSVPWSKVNKSGSAHGAPGAKSQVASTLHEVQLLQHTWLLNGSTSKTGMMDIQMDSRMELESWT